MTKVEELQGKFYELYSKGLHHNTAMDLFIRWIVEADFEKKSFKKFIKYTAANVEELQDAWESFIGLYDTDYKGFAHDYVDKSERSDYLYFVKEELWRMGVK